MVATRGYAESLLQAAAGGLSLREEFARIDKELARLDAACPQYAVVYDAVEGSWSVSENASALRCDKGLASYGGTIAAVGEGAAFRYDVYEGGKYVRTVDVAEEFASLRSDLDKGTTLRGGRYVTVEDGFVDLSIPVVTLVANYADPCLATATAVYDAIAAGRYTLPAATASLLGGVKVGAGLSSASDGTLSVDGATFASAERLDEVAERLDDVEAAVTAGYSDGLVAVDPSDDGTVEPAARRVTFVRVPAASKSLRLVLPASAASGFARDLCVVLAFPGDWSGGAFTVSSVTVADGSDPVLYGVGGAPDLSGASPGGRVVLYFTEYVAGAFMVTAKTLVPFMFQEAT